MMLKFKFVRIGVVALGLAALSAIAAAQPVTRAAPPNDLRVNAMRIHPNSVINVPSVEQATTTGGDWTHACHPGAANDGDKNIWFIFALPSGTVTLDTTGTQYNTIGSSSSDSIVSLYNDGGASLGCSDNLSAAGNLTAPVSGGFYYAQVSAVQGVPVTLASTVTLTFSFVASGHVSPHDSFANPIKLKFPANPTVLNFGNGTVQPGEAVPSCATSESDSHSFWYKFKLKVPRTFIFANAAGDAGETLDLEYSKNFAFVIYRKPAAGLPQVSDEAACGIGGYAQVSDLPAGSYYLRLSADVEGGSTYPVAVSFYNIVSMNSNYSFEVSNAGGSLNDPLLAPYKVKNSNGGDAVVCGLAGGVGDCMFRFTGSPGEDTTLKFKSNLTKLRVQPGDILRGLIGYRTTAVPDATITIKIKYTNGTSSSHTYDLVHQPTLGAFQIGALPLTGTLASIKVKVNHKTTAGTLELDGVLIGIARLGVAARGPLDAPGAGVLPVPPAP